MYKVVLLGAAGQLGRLVQAQVPAEVALHAYASSTLDITNRAALQDCMATLQPDLVINAAAYTQVDKAEAEPAAAYAVNADGPENIALAVPAKTRIIHISTDFVFDGQKNTPYLPEDEPKPLSVYGASKLQGERRLQALRPDSIIIRTAWLYSATGKNFMNTMLALMASRDEVRVVADQRGTPTSAHILAELIWRFAELLRSAPSAGQTADADKVSDSLPSGIFHWTDNGACSWYDFAVAIQQTALQLGLLQQAIPLLPITTADYPTAATRPAYSVLDKTRTLDTLQITAVDWQQSLHNTLLLLT